MLLLNEKLQYLSVANLLKKQIIMSSDYLKFLTSSTNLKPKGLSCNLDNYRNFQMLLIMKLIKYQAGANILEKNDLNFVRCGNLNNVIWIS